MQPNDSFIDHIVTCGEIWIVYDNRWRSWQWLDKDEVPKHFLKSNLHQKKIMMTDWWSSVDLINFSFLNLGETITVEKYCHEVDEVH